MSCSYLQVLGSPTCPCKFLKTLVIHTLKRLASAVQLRPWPPHFKAVNGIASYPPSPLSVRYFSARSGSIPGYDDGEGLNLELPLAQSAFSPLLSAAWLKIAVGISPCRSHAILADTVGITLQGQPLSSEETSALSRQASVVQSLSKKFVFNRQRHQWSAPRVRKGSNC